ncbi:MAG: twin-arginine translocase TatA/TatE family subunit [Bacteroidales bacterium]|nr:twin-arginine translocase TatA/TatE family subunit [Bacteroidales bacterium]
MNAVILFGGIGAPEIILAAVIILLLFGGRKIPELMRGLGKGMKEFKKASKDDNDSSDDDILKSGKALQEDK